MPIRLSLERPPLANFGTPPHPATYPQLQFMLLADDTAALFQTAADTTPVTTTGQFIGRWRSSFGSKSMIFDEATNLPTWKTLQLGTNSRAGVKFDGTNDKLVHTEADIFNTHAEGDLFFAYQHAGTIGIPASTMLLASADTAVATKYLFVEAPMDGHYTLNARNAGAISEIAGDANVTIDIISIVNIRSNGSRYKLYYDGVQDGNDASAGNNGLWFSGVSDRDNISLGARVDNIPDGFANMYLGCVLYFYPKLPDLHRKLVTQWLMDYYNQVQLP